MVTPSLEKFKELSKAANLLAISMPVTTDLDTPVSAFYKLVGEEKGFLLESADAHQSFGRFSFIGAEPFINIQVYKSRLLIQEEDEMRVLSGDPVAAINKYMKGLKSSVIDDALPLVNGGAVGYFNYEISAVFDRVRNVNIDDEDMLGQFMICRVLLAFDQQKNISWLIYLVNINSEQSLTEIYETAVERLHALANRLHQPIEYVAKRHSPRQEKVDFFKRYGKMPDSFARMIEKCKEYIIAGDIFQVVPSCQFQEKLTKPIFHFYRRLRQVNPSPYMFYLNFGRKKFVAASPEMLVKVAGSHVYTYPIAGTRRRGATEAEDKQLADELKADVKECAEHSMLVDLARNDIGRISKPGSVKVTKLQAVERFSHVMHMVSEVMGTLKDGITPMEVLKGCFPAGTVSGAPKLRAMEIINELEPVRRGAYAGTVGYMDFGGNMDMCITLRTMLVEGDKAFIQSGAGIVYDSKADFEYKEILQKSRAMFTVVEEVENDVVTFR